MIGLCEKQAIIRALQGIQPKRPLTHELLYNLVEKLNLSVKEVVITEIKNRLFCSDVYFNDSHKVDARPSDAIFLALRFNAPIFITEDLIKETGVTPFDAPMPSTKKRKTNSKPISKIDRLQTELNKAVANEDYEKAAKLRDKIKTFTSGYN